MSYLDREETNTELAVLADELADADADAERDRVAVRLHHVHLPKLDDAGVLTYDAATRTVEREGAADRLDPYLMLARADERGDVVRGAHP
ncbi:hypothetical protein ACFQHK_14735 [Halomarina ordinaria]|uniref:DUF7344 domain-containing protein n=1 Tax=Halomarina ordinaria TaxID=3033939 RepID=A0ABD5UBY6_9EURY|nr:hypothetical protein [Halomarina sp. PSRA2]